MKKNYDPAVTALLLRLQQHLSDGLEAIEAGFHFEEGGCFGMALAIRDTVMGIGGTCRLAILDADGFIHAAAEAEDALIDHRGVFYTSPANVRFVDEAEFFHAAAEYGHSQADVEADKATAQRAIAVALEITPNAIAKAIIQVIDRCLYRGQWLAADGALVGEALIRQSLPVTMGLQETVRQAAAAIMNWKTFASTPEAAEATPEIRAAIETVSDGGLTIAIKDIAARQEAFVRWFGNSQVTDGFGRPMEVFHGTAASFNQFSPTGGIGGASWFSSSRSVAESHAHGQGSRVVSAIVSIRNPLVAHAKGPVKGPSYWAEHARTKGHDGLILTTEDDAPGTGPSYAVFSEDQIRILNSEFLDPPGLFEKPTPEPIRPPRG